MPNPLNNVYKTLRSLGFYSPCSQNEPGVVAHKDLKVSIAVSLADDEVLLTLETPEKRFYGAIPVERIFEAFSKTWLKGWVRMRLEDAKHS